MHTQARRVEKALTADSKLLAIGTPVESRLSEFLYLINVAQPGPLMDCSYLGSVGLS